MIESDLNLFLEIRNKSLKYLHNNTKFTLLECKEWFIETKPEYFMIELDGKSVGYFRTSNWVNNSMYLGCDIHPKYRNLGIGQKAYTKFIKELYLKYKVKTIQLEVLETNERAIHLYKKLGFVKIGESKNKIVRNDNKITSIIMEHKN